MIHCTVAYVFSLQQSLFRFCGDVVRMFLAPAGADADNRAISNKWYPQIAFEGH